MTYSVEEGDIYIIPWQHPLFSYLPEFCIVTEGVDMDKKAADYAENIRKMLFDIPAVGEEPTIGSETEDNQQQQSDNSAINVDCSYMELTYHGNSQSPIVIKDKAVCAELLRLILDAKSQKPDSTKVYPGTPFTITVYREGEEPIKFSVWNRDGFQIADENEFFIDGELTELSNYLEDHYPANA